MSYIKKFNEFVSVNESFKSGKLRSIIQQYGYPASQWDNEILYDTTDDDVVGVVDNIEEYKELYKNDGSRWKFKGNKTFYVELKSGKLLVLSNFGVLQNYVENEDSETLLDRIEKMKKNRRKYNQGVQYTDSLVVKHQKNINDLEEKRYVEKLRQQGLDKEISKYVEDYINSNMSSLIDIDSTSLDIDLDNIVINDVEFGVYIEMSISCEEGLERYGAIPYDVYGRITKFEIYFEDGEVLIDALETGLYVGETEFEDSDSIETITDYYSYYGVSRSDFF